MSTINTIPMNHSAIMKIYAERDEIDLEPEYQRRGNIWSLEKKQLLIDSVINNYDIPKIYFHELSNSQHEYSVIDGRQRLETIWGFMDGKFALADDFKYFKDTSLELKSLTYNDLANKYPKIRINFDSFNLPIVVVQTDDIDLIEDMFSRLNEAVPLNAAEKRNAVGGNAVKAIRKLTQNEFFENKIRVKNNRYQYYEITAKLLYLEDCVHKERKIIDTSKSFLDKFVEHYKDQGSEQIDFYANNVQMVLDGFNKVFSDEDQLLKRQGDIPVYYLLLKDAINQNLLSKISRQKLVDFQERIEKVAKQTFEQIDENDYIFYDYYSNTQQGTNNSSNIRARVQILESFFEIDYDKSIVRFH
ncbi:MAG: hypothetical protein QG567_574 [Campylobacterota bacterium]|nr:hypothetical protein [Campylobacterota bacterium]